MKARTDLSAPTILSILFILSSLLTSAPEAKGRNLDRINKMNRMTDRTSATPDGVGCHSREHADRENLGASGVFEHGYVEWLSAVAKDRNKACYRADRLHRASNYRIRTWMYVANAAIISLGDHFDGNT
jgi:hypothetical protein